MSRLGPEPRVNAKYLSAHKGQTVRLTAKVIRINNDVASVESSDGQEVSVHMPRDMHIEDTFVEFIGTVKDDLSVRALTTIGLGKNLDMKAVNAVVEFGHSPKGDGVLA